MCHGHASKEVNGVRKRRRRQHWPKPCGAFADTRSRTPASQQAQLHETKPDKQLRDTPSQRLSDWLERIKIPAAASRRRTIASPPHQPKIPSTHEPEQTRERPDDPAPAKITTKRPRPRPAGPDLGPPPPSHGHGRDIAGPRHPPGGRGSRTAGVSATCRKRSTHTQASSGAGGKEAPSAVPGRTRAAQAPAQDRRPWRQPSA